MIEDALSELKQIVGSTWCSTSVADLYDYSFDSSIHGSRPDVVVRPKTTEEVQKIVLLANEKKIPIISRGAGTAMCGHTVPIKGGIILDLTRMDEIEEVRVEDLYCRVQPGVIYDALNKVLGKKGFWFPTSPGSAEICTIGGMVATNASGMRAIKYGATRDHVLGMEIVMPTGEIMRTGTKTLKNASGYQIDRLMVGSEGTLGVITDITLKLTMKPQKVAMVLAAFDNVYDAGKCVANIISKPLIPSSIEIMDDVCIKAINKCKKTGFPDVEALVNVEVDGYPCTVEQEMKVVDEICRKSGASTVESSDDKATMAKWTEGRKSILPSLSRYGDEFVSVALADDMAVPISKVPDAVVRFHEISKETGTIFGTYGHSADGNLHTKLLVNPTSEGSWKAAEETVGRIYKAVLELGGTVTGEHGVAITKAPYMMEERKDSLETMRKIKRALDPNNIMNPGKIFDWEQGSVIKYLRYPVRDK
ncbi:MAG: FAD-binding oxidoreductase [Thermoplasmata archaeon]|nr:FAD-binding oxidoreductase [Thermoplasmata archaeon]